MKPFRPLPTGGWLTQRACYKQPGGTVQKHRGPRLRTFVKRPSTVQRYYVGRRYSVNFTFML